MNKLTLNIHTFDSTEEAYDSVMTGETPVGDILYIPSEKVVGVADTYPFAISKEHGELHSLESPGSFQKMIDDMEKGLIDSSVSELQQALDFYNALGLGE